MKARREIHALDYAICMAMSALDIVFHRHCEWWRINKGFNIEIEDLRHTSSMDAYVHVRPVGWREDEYIVLRCRKFYEWKAFEAFVFSSRLPKEFSLGRFTCSIEYDKLIGRDTESEKFLRRVMPGWFKNTQPVL